jgi:HK97 gp10 family phage protein
MSDGFSITFSDEWTTLHQRLATFGEKVAKQVTVGALRETAAIMKASAKEKVSQSNEEHYLKVKKVYVKIKPSNLKKEIRFRKLRERGLDDGELAYQVYVRIRSAWYAKFVEFGRSNMAPRPFMRPTFEQHAADLPIIFKSKIDALIKQGGF